MLLAAIPLVAQLVIPIADQFPQLNVEPSCKAAEARSATGRSADTCLRSERDARDQASKQWTEFPVADRNYCVNLSTLGGSPSYVELLTCLEMARDVRNVHRKAAPSTTGQAPSDAPSDSPPKP